MENSDLLVAAHKDCLYDTMREIAHYLDFEHSFGKSPKGSRRIHLLKEYRQSSF